MDKLYLHCCEVQIAHKQQAPHETYMVLIQPPSDSGNVPTAQSFIDACAVLGCPEANTHRKGHVL